MFHVQKIRCHNFIHNLAILVYFVLSLTILSSWAIINNNEDLHFVFPGPRPTCQEAGHKSGINYAQHLADPDKKFKRKYETRDTLPAVYMMSTKVTMRWFYQHLGAMDLEAPLVTWLCSSRSVVRERICK